MRSFTSHKGLVLPLDYSNVDTDVIIPKQYLKSTKRTGFGLNLFDSWRYLDEGELGQNHSARKMNPEFVMNQSRYKGASIAIARENFGCGSSREHAVWAFTDAGYYAIVAVSFAEIFLSNCLKNGFLPIKLPANCVSDIFTKIYSYQGYKLSIDLPSQIVSDTEQEWHFEIEEFAKKCLLDGLDTIALTLQHSDKIKEYEEKRKKKAPWLFLRNIDQNL